MSGFPRSHRLVSKKDFQSVFANPHKLTYKYLIVLYKNNQFDHPRLGMLIGKQHVPLAVNRNDIRRVLRESFRYYQEVLKGLDIVVLIRSKCSPLGKKALRDDIDQLWRKLASSSNMV